MTGILRKTTLSLTFLVPLAAVWYITQPNSSVSAATVQAPRFEVDPMWPKPLPNHWVMGATIGVSVDAQDHIWIVHRPGSLERMETYAGQNPPLSECCSPAPPVLEF